MKAKKSLGQNFLIDQKISQKIIDAAHLTQEDVVLEVGPGTGFLTENLLSRARKVIAVEIDQNLCSLLMQKFTLNKNFSLVCKSILDCHIEKLICENEKELQTGIVAKSDRAQLYTYKVIANLPYYITSKILRFFLENPCKPTEMIVMVQKEVAERIVAPPGKMSLLSVSVQYYARVEILFPVLKNAFDPVPGVDSAVIKITPFVHPHKKQTPEETEHFFRVVKSGYSARRKTLVNNLSNGFHRSKDDVTSVLHNLGFQPTVRAQELSVDNWQAISLHF